MVVALNQIVFISYPSPVHGFLNADLGLPQPCVPTVVTVPQPVEFWILAFEPRAHSSSHILHLVSSITYLLSYLLLVVFAVPVYLEKCKGLNRKSVSQCAMVLICWFLIMVGVFDSWIALHSSNVSFGVLQQ
jgi:hypothetical protein